MLHAEHVPCVRSNVCVCACACVGDWIWVFLKVVGWLGWSTVDDNNNIRSCLSPCKYVKFNVFINYGLWHWLPGWQAIHCWRSVCWRIESTFAMDLDRFGNAEIVAQISYLECSYYCAHVSSGNHKYYSLLPLWISIAIQFKYSFKFVQCLWYSLQSSGNRLIRKRLFVRNRYKTDKCCSVRPFLHFFQHHVWDHQPLWLGLIDII